MVYRPWKLLPSSEEEVRRLEKELGALPLLCRVLSARGLADKAQEICSLSPLSPYTDMPGMEAAVQRVQQALDNGEKIVVFGDYDTDGITATALLFSFFQAEGANVFYKLPSRQEEGYGLSKIALDRIAKAGVSLVVTVDSGISAVEETAYAKTLGIDVVITDHHLPPDTLPAVAAIVNPMMEGSRFPTPYLAGVGVALYFAAAVEGCAAEELLDVYGDLVALGTVADLMPLSGDNRTLVKAGLLMLQESERPGLRALLAQAGVEGTVTEQTISYMLAPRLNAAGRMGDAVTALRLLLTEDEEEAQALAAVLVQQNQDRQKTEADILCAAMEQVEQDTAYAQEPVLVVWGGDYHQGVIGIVASRLVEKYGKPALVVSVSEGEGKGSGRSMTGFDLHAALECCSGHLIRYGGHALAAGFSLEEKNLPLFRQCINAYARQHWQQEESPLLADSEITLRDLTAEAVADLSRLAPFGVDNRAPLFLVAGAMVDGVWPVSDGKHSRLRLRQGSDTTYAMLFGTGPAALPYQNGDSVDALLSLSIYESARGPMVSARLKDIRPAALGNAHTARVNLLEKYKKGAALEAAEVDSLCATREDVAAVYRAISGRSFAAEDLRPLFAALPAVDAGRVALSAQALLELGLVSAENGTLTPVKMQGKKNLADSPLLAALWKRRA